ncbi:MAG: bifunctional DNA-formamidopyrimidine glycosylase/DNA-(apurinic or apyrimidinic site) lyase [Alphaproteobacteria bacterium]|nr:MAG: bifunctional DNA-formamidopyrimidine glycosylase/DNA-(apurinic or apyrimidinic site) lyase [Alphaproteobacteria bacterium]
MPELPEVETVARGIAPVLVGRRLRRALVRRPDLRIPLPTGFAGRLAGRRVDHVGRRAKYLLVDLDDGQVLVIHLGMSGRLTIQQGRSLADLTLGVHDHVAFETDAGDSLVFHDPRRFGLMTLVEGSAVANHRLFAGLGPEPLGNGFTPAYLTEVLRGRQTTIKAALLDQRVVAGLGNIYVCEALYRSGISPRRRAASVAGRRTDRLVPAIRDVLQEAIAAGGSTLRDYAQANGALGYFQHGFSVYDRAGEMCRTPGCERTVARIVQHGRSTFFCPGCQR